MTFTDNIYIFIEQKYFLLLTTNAVNDHVYQYSNVFKCKVQYQCPPSVKQVPIGWFCKIRFVFHYI